MPTIVSGAIGGDRGHDDRPSRRGLGRRAVEGGSFTRGERMAKWNEVLRIEEALGGKARFAGGSVLGRSRP